MLDCPSITEMLKAYYHYKKSQCHSLNHRLLLALLGSIDLGVGAD